MLPGHPAPPRPAGARSAHAAPTRVPARVRSARSPARRSRARSDRAASAPCDHAPDSILERIQTCHPKARTGAAAAKKVAAQRTQERRARAGAHQEHLQQHHRLDHGPDRRRGLLGLRPVRSASRARASRPRSPHSWPPRRPPAGRWSTACARSTSSSRARSPAAETAIRSLTAAGLEVGTHLRRHAAAAQRMPSAEASSGLRQEMRHGSLHRCRLAAAAVARR